MFRLRSKILPRLSRWYCSHSLPHRLRRPLKIGELKEQRLTRNQHYAYCVHYFDRYLPQIFVEHRRYFNSEGRGFGEDAFHVMWYLLFQEHHPKTALEIGVFRGQTVTLWKLLARHFHFDCQVGCVSPFAAVGDSVSKYSVQVDYLEDLYVNHRHFEVEPPRVCRCFSTDPEARRFITSQVWDAIYIDGNHDYEVAKQDWETCSAVVAPGGLVVLDDSALETDYRPPLFATAGHPGPSRLSREIPSDRFAELLSVGHNRVFVRIP